MTHSSLARRNSGLVDENVTSAAQWTSSPSYTLGRVPLSDWREFAEAHPNSTAFHHAHWLQLLMDQYGFGLHVFAVRKGGHILGAVPFLETTDIWGGKKLVSLPFTDCIGVLVEHPYVMDLIREELGSERYGKYKAIVIRTHEPTCRHETVGQWRRHTIDTSC